MCLHGALCSYPLSLVCNITTFRKKKTFFDILTPPQGSRVCVRTEYACLSKKGHNSVNFLQMTSKFELDLYSVVYDVR